MNDKKIEQSLNYETCRASLGIQLIGQKGNEEKLANIPHKIIEDLALICCIDLSDLEKQYGLIKSAPITSQLLECFFGITEEQLFKDAVENSTTLHPATLQSLLNVVAEMTEDKPLVTPAEGPMVLVATNRDRFMGASVICYPGFLEQAAEKIGGNYFILPSSIHEVILFQDDGNTDPRMLAAVVQSVNLSQVDPKDNFRITSTIMIARQRNLN